MVPFARALEEAGHAVAFVASKEFLPNIEKAGFDGFSGGLNLWDDERLANDLDRFQSLTSHFELLLFAYTETFRRIRPNYMIPDLLQVAEMWQPDIIIRESVELGGCVAAEMLSLPHAMVGAMEFHPEYVERAFWPSLDLVRNEFGLPPDPDGLMSHCYLTITGVLPEWVGPYEVCPPVTHFVRPEQFDNLDSVELPGWILDLPDRPTVHASMGTVFNTVPGNYEAILVAIREEPINLIVAIGANRDPEEFGPQPENDHFVPYLPHSLLLPHCDLMISHAGLGATTACLLNDVPAVMLPVTGDQPHNAQRFADFGAGIAIHEQFRSPERVREAVLMILDDPSYRENVCLAHGKLDALPGTDYAVQLLERLAEEKQPIVNEELLTA